MLLKITIVLAFPVVILIQLVAVPVTIMVPGYSVMIRLVPFVGSGVPVLRSDEIEQNGLMKYAVPIVKVFAANISFTAPLSTRLYNQNSSAFQVQQTGYYELVALSVVPLKYQAAARLFTPVKYDQLSSSEFNYLPIYRDAELYYCMFVSGYSNITSLSISYTFATYTKEIKLIYGISSNNTVLIAIDREGDLVPLDSTTATSTDAQLLQLFEVTLSQAKVVTDYSSSVERPAPPFIVL